MTYVDLPTESREAFTALSTTQRALQSIYSGSFTTAAKRAEAKKLAQRLVQEAQSFRKTVKA